MMDSAPLGAATTAYSCLSCRQRKIKCDKQQPCLNCVRAQKECIRSTPAPPRRRKGRVKLSEEQLLRRLRQYEMILKGYGVKVEDLERLDRGNVILSSEAKQLSLQSGRSGAPVHSLWTNLSDELLEGLDEEEEESSYSMIYDFETPAAFDADIFVFDPRPFDTDLTHFHPQAAQIFKLWHTFLDNVNPLSKIIHGPTIQKLLLEASVDLENVSRPMEALMFAIYSCAFTSLSDDECKGLMGEGRGTLRARYHKVTQQALMRAGLFGTLNIMVLQAAVLFLVAFRREYDPGELWVFIGVVIRIGQRIGLHRESDSTNLSVLDVEIRRRLCWQMDVLDLRSAERSGVGISVNAILRETPRPLNVNDNDLTPDMKVPPLDQVGVTEMIFPLMMYELGAFLRHSKSMAAFDGSWQRLSDHRIPPSEKDRIVDEVEAMLESKFLKYCDPVIPLHILAQGAAKIVCGRLRLTTRHPRRYPDRGISMSQAEKVKLFDICLMMVEQDNLLHSIPSLRGFLWHVDFQSQLDAIVYLLSELRYNNSGELADKAWAQIEEAFAHHPHIINNTKDPLYGAVRSLTLRSWEARGNEYTKQKLIPPNSSLPSFIMQIRSLRASSNPSLLFELPVDYDAGHPAITYPDSHFLAGCFNGNLDSSIERGAMNTDSEAMDWNYWNDLMQVAGSSEMMTYGTQEIYDPSSTLSYPPA